MSFDKKFIVQVFVKSAKLLYKQMYHKGCTLKSSYRVREGTLYFVCNDADQWKESVYKGHSKLLLKASCMCENATRGAILGMLSVEPKTHCLGSSLCMKQK